MRTPHLRLLTASAGAFALLSLSNSLAQDSHIEQVPSVHRVIRLLESCADNPTNRSTSVSTLQSFGDEAVLRITEYLHSVPGDIQNEDLWICGLRVLRGIPNGAQGVADLLPLLGPSGEELEYEIATITAQLGEQVLPELIDTLSRNAPHLALRAVMTLSHMDIPILREHQEELLPVVLGVWNDPPEFDNANPRAAYRLEFFTARALLGIGIVEDRVFADAAAVFDNHCIDREERISFITFLSDLGDGQQIAQTLGAGLKDEDYLVATQAIFALMKMGINAAPAQYDIFDASERMPGFTSIILKRLEKQGITVPVQYPPVFDEFERESAAQGGIESLSQNEQECARWSQQLIETLTDRDRRVRARACTLLGTIAPYQDPARLNLHSMMQDPSPSVRTAAAQAFATLGNFGVSELLLELENRSDEARIAGIRQLGHMPQYASVTKKPLIDALKQPRKNPFVIEAIIEALAGFGPSEEGVIDALIYALSIEGPGSKAALALGRFGPAAQSAIPYLVESLEDPFLSDDTGAVEIPDSPLSFFSLINHRIHRTLAAEALASIGGASIPYLIEATRSQDQQVRLGAMEAARNLLLPQLKSDNVEERDAAMNSLLSLCAHQPPEITEWYHDAENLLDDPQNSIRQIGLVILSLMGRDGERKVVSALKDDALAPLATQVILAMKKAPILELELLANDTQEDEVVRLRAITVLMDLPTTSGITLNHYLNIRDSLRFLNVEARSNVLRQLLTDSDFVQAVAQEPSNENRSRAVQLIFELCLETKDYEILLENLNTLSIPELDPLLALLFCRDKKIPSAPTAPLLSAMSTCGSGACLQVLGLELDHLTRRPEPADKAVYGPIDLIETLYAIDEPAGLGAALQFFSTDASTAYTLSIEQTEVLIAMITRARELPFEERIMLLRAHTMFIARFVKDRAIASNEVHQKMAVAIAQELIELATPASLATLRYLVDSPYTEVAELARGADYQPLTLAPWLVDELRVSLITQPNPATGRLRAIENNDTLSIVDHIVPHLPADAISRCAPLQYHTTSTLQYLKQASSSSHNAIENSEPESLARGRSALASVLLQNIRRKLQQEPDANAARIDSQLFVDLEHDQTNPLRYELPALQNRSRVTFPNTKYGTNRSLAPVIAHVQQETRRLLIKVDVPPKAIDTVSSYLVHEEFKKLACALYGVIQARRALGKPRFGIALESVYDELNTLTAELATSTGRSRITDRILPSANAPPLLLLSAHVTSITLEQRDISPAEGRYREVVRLSVQDDEHAETNQIFTWTGNLPLGHRDIIRQYPILADLSGEIYSLREINSTMHTGRGVIRDIDLIQADPYRAITILLSDCVIDDLPWDHIQEALVLSGTREFASLLPEYLSLTELGHTQYPSLPTLPGTGKPQNWIQQQFTTGIVSDDAHATLRQALNKPIADFIGAELEGFVAESLIPIINTYPNNLPDRYQTFTVTDYDGRPATTTTRIPGGPNRAKQKMLADLNSTLAAAKKTQSTHLIWDGHCLVPHSMCDYLVFGAAPPKPEDPKYKDWQQMAKSIRVLRSCVNDSLTQYVTLYEVHTNNARTRVIMSSGSLDDRYRAFLALGIARDPSLVQRYGLDPSGFTDDFNGTLETQVQRGLSMDAHGGLLGHLKFQGISTREMALAGNTFDKLKHLPMHNTMKDHALQQVADAARQAYRPRRNWSDRPNLLDFRKSWCNARNAAVTKANEHVHSVIDRINRDREKSRKQNIGFFVSVTLAGPSIIPAFKFSYGDFSITLSSDLSSDFSVSPAWRGFAVNRATIDAVWKYFSGPSFDPAAVDSANALFGKRNIPIPTLHIPRPPTPSSSTRPIPSKPELRGPTLSAARPVEPFSHDWLRKMDDQWADREPVRESLLKNKLTLQTLDQAYGEPAYDEFSVTAQLPAGVDPYGFLNTMLSDVDTAVDDFWFSVMNNFARADGLQDARAQIGDVYNIDFIGPFNAPVMLVDRQINSFTFYTLSGHPISGSRTFGFIENADGTTTFYTRGVSAPVDRSPFRETQFIERRLQNFSWDRWLAGIKRKIELKKEDH